MDNRKPQGRSKFGAKKSSSFKKDSSDKPKRSFSKEGGERSFDKPKRATSNRDERPSYGDKPKRNFSKEGGESSFEKPKRASSDRAERPSYGDKPKRSFSKEGGEKSFDKPKRSSFERGERASYADKPKRSFDKEGIENQNAALPTEVNVPNIMPIRTKKAKQNAVLLNVANAQTMIQANLRTIKKIIP